MRTTNSRRFFLSVLAGVVAWASLVVAEAFAQTRLQSFYIAANDFNASALYTLIGERQRGYLLEIPGKGFHSAEPGQTQQQVTEMLKQRYPNEFDNLEVTWVLSDEEGAFFYRLSPNWPVAAFLVGGGSFVFWLLFTALANRRYKRDAPL
jgi:hypothetical protein